VCVCVYVFLSRVLFFFFWLGLPYLVGLLGVLILSPQQLTATPDAAAVSTRVLDNQHACFIVSSSSRLRPSLLFSSLLFHLALALTVSLSLPLLRPLLRARAGESFVRLGNAQTRRRTRGWFWRILQRAFFK